MGRVLLTAARPQRGKSSVPLRARLEARRPDIEEAALARTIAMSAASQDGAADVAGCVRREISAILDYSFAITEGDLAPEPAIPEILLTHTRLAAQRGIGLEMVRRISSSYALLTHFLIETVTEGSDSERAELQQLLDIYALLFDRLMSAIADEYAYHSRSRSSSTEQRRLVQIKKLLAGAFVDTSDLAYEFRALHLGAIAQGVQAAEVLRDAAAAIDCRLLVVHRDEDTVWAWLGRRRSINLDRLASVISSQRPVKMRLAFGEPGKGLAGWRRSHQQAQAAFSIASCKPENIVRYADVALLASMAQDDLLATSLREIYLAPLAEERDGGFKLRQTLLAYFDAGCNGASAAAALGVRRQTVNQRLQKVEKRIGRPVASCTRELSAALHLDELNRAPERPT